MAPEPISPAPTPRDSGFDGSNRKAPIAVQIKAPTVRPSSPRPVHNASVGTAGTVQVAAAQETAGASDSNVFNFTAGG